MKLLLVYVLAIGIGILFQYFYGILYGAAAAVLVPASLLRRLPATFAKHHNKLYLHLLWISSQLGATVTACFVLNRFEVPIGFSFIFLLCAGPALVFNSGALRKPENLGYFNFSITSAERYIVITNRLEGLSRMIGLFAGLLLIRR